jgi:hypothetical protein
MIGCSNTTPLDERVSMASEHELQDAQGAQRGLFGRKQHLLVSPHARRSAFLSGAVGAADFAILYLFFSPGLTGLRLDTGARVLLYLTVTSLGLVIVAIGLRSLRLVWYQLVAPYVFVAGALCTAVAFELLLAQLDAGAFWCLLPWLVITAVIIAVPVLHDATAIWREHHEAIEQRWRHLFAR